MKTTRTSGKPTAKKTPKVDPMKPRTTKDGVTLYPVFGRRGEIIWVTIPE